MDLKETLWVEAEYSTIVEKRGNVCLQIEIPVGITDPVKLKTYIDEAVKMWRNDCITDDNIMSDMHVKYLGGIAKCIYEDKDGSPQYIAPITEQAILTDKNKKFRLLMQLKLEAGGYKMAYYANTLSEINGVLAEYHSKIEEYKIDEQGNPNF